MQSMMSPMGLFRWLLLSLVPQSIAHDMQSFQMTLMTGWLFQCANTTCSSSVTLTVSNARSCQIACLNNVFCRAASFQRSSSSCELFAYIPNQSESVSTDLEITTMIVIVGTRVPSGEYGFYNQSIVLRSSRNLSSY